MSTGPSPDTTGHRLGQVVLAYLALIVAVVTLSPFRFALPPSAVALGWNAFDVVMNVVIFVPFGFIHRISRPQQRGASWLGALGYGAALSGLIEVAQTFLPGRFPSPVDLVTNTAGAGLGSWLGGLTRERVDAVGAVRTSAVELPLMGLVYLLAPLAWLVGLGSRDGIRSWLVLTLVASGGWIIASVLTSFAHAARSRVLVATGVWLAVALAPGFLGAPARAVVAAALGLATAWIRTVAPTRFTHEVSPAGAPRRFEAATLRMVLPLFFVHLVASSLTPPARPGARWVGMWALLPAGGSLGNDVIYRALEHIAAFSLIGYAIAEYQGRARDRFATVLPLVVGSAALTSAALELARGWNAAYRASALMFALTLVGAGFGTWLYTLQLAHVRALLRSGAAP
jgi:glycopeptide antibiotics resistance protein